MSLLQMRRLSADDKTTPTSSSFRWLTMWTRLNRRRTGGPRCMRVAVVSGTRCLARTTMMRLVYAALGHDYCQLCLQLLLLLLASPHLQRITAVQHTPSSSLSLNGVDYWHAPTVECHRYYESSMLLQTIVYRDITRLRRFVGRIVSK